MNRFAIICFRGIPSGVRKLRLLSEQAGTTPRQPRLPSRPATRNWARRGSGEALRVNEEQRMQP
jgi:hypothetical protein